MRQVRARILVGDRVLKTREGVEEVRIEGAIVEQDAVHTMLLGMVVDILLTNGTKKDLMAKIAIKDNDMIHEGQSEWAEAYGKARTWYSSTATQSRPDRPFDPQRENEYRSMSCSWTLCTTEGESPSQQSYAWLHEPWT
jgi:hypothetical protein